MRILPITAGVALFACGLAAHAQAPVPCGQTLDTPLQPGAQLTIDSVSAGVDIVGTDAATVHVTCTSNDSDTARDVHLHVSGTPTRAKLEITGEHLNHNNLSIRIEVPRKTNLDFQMAAGAVKVNDIVGDKNIELTAGNLTVASDREWDYKEIDASVSIGAVNASAYGANKGGFFRDFHKKNAGGEYRLHAHVTTGEIDLLGKPGDMPEAK